jgi:hypothetical protein
MKLSLSNFPLEFFYDIETEQLAMLETIRECGYTCTDYNIRIEYLDERMEERALELKGLLEKCGMTAPQSHAPGLDPFNPPEGVDVYDNITNALSSVRSQAFQISLSTLSVRSVIPKKNSCR